MKRARVAYAGAIHEATPARRRARSASPTAASSPRTDVVWLPPFEVGTVIALGLNYADHAKELAVQGAGRAARLPEGPGRADRPPRRDAPARPTRPSCTTSASSRSSSASRRGRSARADAMDHVAGYTVANDYAIRDYLENWYRPNLRVKNRDGAHRARPVAGRCRRRRRRRRSSRCARSSTASMTQQRQHARPGLRHRRS